jgi:hypothetical protein
MKKNNSKNKSITRRDFIKSAAAITASALIPASISKANDPIIKNPVWSFSAKNRNDITFCMTADTHYDAIYQGVDNEAGNKRVIDRINNMAENLTYPSQFGGGYIQHPRGVACLGDLTNTSRIGDWTGTAAGDGWVDDYGLNGSDGRLNYPVFELYGNHDCTVSNDSNIPKDGIKERNLIRQNVNVSSNGYHYSWDWDDVHFINLNIYPGGPGEAEDSFGFAQQDLAAHVGDSGRPVVIFTHYGWKWFGDEWDELAFYNMVKDLNIIGIFHGHWHYSEYYQWRGFDVFNENASQRMREPGYGNGIFESFFVARITENKLFVGERDHLEQWINLFQKDITFNHVSNNQLKTMSDQWTQSESGLSADLNDDGKVDFKDYSMLAEEWMKPIPPGWNL